MSEKRLVESVNRIIILLRKKSTYLALFHPAQVYQAISMELYWGRFGLSHFLVHIPLCAPKIGFQNTKWAPLEGGTIRYLSTIPTLIFWGPKYCVIPRPTLDPAVWLSLVIWGRVPLLFPMNFSPNYHTSPTITMVP